MAITQVIQTITDYPKLGDTHEVFRQKADICWTDLATAIPQINTWKDQVNTVAADINDKTDLVTTKAQIVSDNLTAINAINDNVTNVNNVGNNIDNVNNVGSNIADVVITAQNITDVNNYSKTYLGAKDTAPTARNDGSELQVGDMYYDTQAKEMRAWSGSEWDSVSPVTYSKAEIDSKFNNITAPTPTITLESTVNENASLVGSYTACDNCDIKISANLGTISNIDRTKKQFTYVAFDITDKQDKSDTITAYAVEEGYVLSKVVTATITVKYVPMVTDDALVDNDFLNNKLYSNGFNF